MVYAPPVHNTVGFKCFVAFTAKSNLIKHCEETLEAYLFKNQRMIIATEAAKILVMKYFKTK